MSGGLIIEWPLWLYIVYLLMTQLADSERHLQTMDVTRNYRHKYTKILTRPLTTTPVIQRVACAVW